MKIKNEYVLLFLLVVFGIYKGFAYSYAVNIKLINLLFLGIGFIFLLKAIYFSSNHLFACKILLTFSFFNLDYLLFSIAIILLPKIIFLYNVKEGLKINKSFSVFILMIIYIAIVSISISFLDFALLPTLLGFVIFLTPLSVFIYLYQFTYNESFLKELFSFFKKIILVQIAIILIQFFIHHTFRPGDWGRGTLESADKVGIFLILLFFFIVIPPILDRQIKLKSLFRLNKIIFLSLLVIFIIYIDVKITLLSIVVGVILFISLIFIGKLFAKLKSLSKSKLILVVLLTCLFFILFPLLFRFYYALVFKDKDSTVYAITKSYIANPNYAQKYKFYSRVYQQMYSEYPTIWVLGTGLGKCGSRASNTFAYDVLYKDPERKLPSFIPPHSSIWVKKYMYNLYTEEIYKRTQWISSNLSIPFAGWITIKAEFGFLGLILWVIAFLLLAYEIFYKSSQFQSSFLRSWGMVVSIYCLCLFPLMIFDNWQEKPQFMLPLMILSSLICKSYVSKQQAGKISD